MCLHTGLSTHPKTYGHGDGPKRSTTNDHMQSLHLKARYLRWSSAILMDQKAVTMSTLAKYCPGCSLARNRCKIRKCGEHSWLLRVRQSRHGRSSSPGNQTTPIMQLAVMTVPSNGSATLHSNIDDIDDSSI